MIPIEEFHISKVNIRKQGNPFLNNRVDNPWDDYPDSQKFNSAAYDRIYNAIQNVIHDKSNQSIGCVIKGEAGTGKTHLLMRIAKLLAVRKPIMFIRRVNDEETVAQYIWSSMIKSLVRPIPENISGEKCPLDEFLTIIFKNILFRIFDAKSSAGVKQYKEFRETLQNDPIKGPELLRSEKHRGVFLNLILSRIQHELPEAERSIVKAFYKFYYYKDIIWRREIQTWLVGRIDDPERLLKLDLPSWIDEGQTLKDHSKKEGMAEKAIQTLSLLSQYYYNEPLIICFDQLEGLRGRNSLVKRYADVVREMFTKCKNFIIITCVFPHLWDEFKRFLDDSYLDRAGQIEIDLEDLDEESAKYVVQARLIDFHKLTSVKDSSSIKPFLYSDVPYFLYIDENNRKSVRTVRKFLIECCDAWDRWLSGTFNVPEYYKSIQKNSVATSTFYEDQLSLSNQLEEYISIKISELNESIQNDIEDDIANEIILFPEIKEIVYFMLIQNKLDIVPLGKTSIVGKRKMPSYERFKFSGNQEFCFALLNNSGNEYTARVRNFLEYAKNSNSNSIILRDYHVGDFPQGGQGGVYLDEYLDIGNTLLMELEEISIIRTLYGALENIHQKDWEFGNVCINPDHFFRWLMKSRYHLNSKFLSQVMDLLN